jgi:hypothetical protein
MLALLPAILLWGLASWGLITAQQARLVALTPGLAAVSLSLNSSAIYLGSATGAAVGALVIAEGGVGRLGWVAAGFSVAVCGVGQRPRHVTPRLTRWGRPIQLRRGWPSPSGLPEASSKHAQSKP